MTDRNQARLSMKAAFATVELALAQNELAISALVTTIANLLNGDVEKAHDNLDVAMEALREAQAFSGEINQHVNNAFGE